ncbi:hypothetical protein PVAP13_5NG015400 [Panicum virgatum]|uniref:Uncharacterized protein n=1 Tax=Panicum virgatum TaxID=38727 RepID=A0A8T0RMV7_PANVG|nr:hypothetical protein PVAP13_5NG015400 [Panicum virgatum]
MTSLFEPPVWSSPRRASGFMSASTAAMSAWTLDGQPAEPRPTHLRAMPWRTTHWMLPLRTSEHVHPLGHLPLHFSNSIRRRLLVAALWISGRFCAVYATTRRQACGLYRVLENVVTYVLLVF